MTDKSILEVVHESAKSLYDAGLMDKITMHEFDALCLAPVKKLNPQEIKQIRIRAKISQPVFAKILNVSTSAVQHWETGDKQPNGAALKLLNLVANKGLATIMI